MSGCWMYEVTINSGGLMQVGWATSHCHLSELTGVGDTPLSVAFDGLEEIPCSATFQPLLSRVFACI